jgi:hypothetical protein
MRKPYELSAEQQARFDAFTEAQQAAHAVAAEAQAKRRQEELRDAFAMAALTGIAAAVTGPQKWNCKADARLAYDFADAMLAARKVKP